MAGEDRQRDPLEVQRAGWMAAAQRGDAAAYETLLSSLLAPLRGFVFRRGVDDGNVEDVVQEILLLLHRARHTWRPERPFEPWLWAIARNATTDALRRQARQRRRMRDRGTDEMDLLPDGDLERGPVANPEERIADRELPAELREALAGLPDAQREAVLLLYVEQLSVAEAARRAGVSPNALKVRAHRGSRALRAALISEEDSR